MEEQKHNSEQELMLTEMVVARMGWGLNLVGREKEPQIPAGVMLPVSYLSLPLAILPPCLPEAVGS